MTAKVISFAQAKQRKQASRKTVNLTVIESEELEFGAIEGDEPVALVLKGHGFCLSLQSAIDFRDGINALLKCPESPWNKKA